MKRWQYLVISIIFGLVAAFNFLAINNNLQIDFSRQKIHSISPATKKIIRRLDKTATIQIFISNKLPVQLLPLRTALISLLDRYRQFSRGKIILKFINPDKNTSSRQEAERLGIKPIEFSSISHDKFQISRGYFAASIKYGNKEEVIPITRIMANLEYNFSAAITKVSRKKPKIIGWASGFQAASPEQLSLAWRLLKQIGQPQLVDLSSLKETDEIDNLIIVNPKEKIDESAKRNLDRFLQTGHGVLLIDDKYQITPDFTAIGINNNLGDLLKHYGFQIEKSFILDKSAALASFQSKQGQTLLVTYPFWPSIQQKNISRNYPALANLNGAILFWANPLILSKKAQPLLQTGPGAWTSQDKNLFPYNIKAPKKTENFVLAGYQDQSIASFYHPQKKHKIRFAVIGDSDFISNQGLYRHPQNATLFLDLVDLVADDSQLAQIRNRTIGAASLKPLSNRQKTLVKAIDLAAPLAMNILFGIGYWLWRRKKSG